MPAETQVYLKEKGLEVLTTEALKKDGVVYVGGPEAQPTNLASQVSTLDPASLTYLNLDYNELTNVDALVSFTGLKWLRLNNNRLESLPDLSGLGSLRRLYLRDNALASVPEFLRPENLPELDTLDLSGNPIAAVPDWLAQRKGLRHLSLSDTAVTALPKDLSAWQSLKSLQLGGLRLGSLEELKRIRAALPDTAVVF
ncbi:MAG: leucine-rich repeat domain-containing protein [Kiritimatiellia bacterium]